MRIPGTLFTIWLVSPCPMNPAPIIPTRMNFPCLSRSRRALSTIIMLSSHPHLLLQHPLDLIEKLPIRVLLRNLHHRQRPPKPETGVIVMEAALRTRRVEFADLVAGLRSFRENLVSVREPLRHVERPVIVGIKFHRNMFQVSRALRTQVQDDVQDRAARAAHELRFRGGRELKMHPAKRASLFAKGDVGLGDYGLKAVFREFLLAERAREETPAVLPALHVNDEGAFQLRLGEYHLFVLRCLLTHRSMCRVSCDGSRNSL